MSLPSIWRATATTSLQPCWGGCQIVVRDEGRIITDAAQLPPDLMAVVLVPDAPMATSEARAVLPDMVSREEAVYNLGRAAMLVNGLSTGRLDKLRVATQDVLHQPARQAIFPAMKYVLRAALDAGAAGAFLSGGRLQRHGAGNLQAHDHRVRDDKRCGQSGRLREPQGDQAVHLGGARGIY